MDLVVLFNFIFVFGSNKEKTKLLELISASFQLTSLGCEIMPGWYKCVGVCWLYIGSWSKTDPEGMQTASAFALLPQLAAMF